MRSDDGLPWYLKCAEGRSGCKFPRSEPKILSSCENSGGRLWRNCIETFSYVVYLEWVAVLPVSQNIRFHPIGDAARHSQIHEIVYTNGACILIGGGHGWQHLSQPVEVILWRRRIIELYYKACASSLPALEFMNAALELPNKWSSFYLGLKLASNAISFHVISYRFSSASAVSPLLRNKCFTVSLKRTSGGNLSTKNSVSGSRNEIAINSVHVF